MSRECRLWTPQRCNYVRFTLFVDFRLKIPFFGKISTKTWKTKTKANFRAASCVFFFGGNLQFKSDFEKIGIVFFSKL